MTSPRKRVIDRESRGFTLVELLVAITVIGILAAILIPTISAMLRSAGEFAISNNVQQLDAAVDKFHSTYGFYPSDFSEFVDTQGNALGFRDALPAKFGGITVETRLKQFLSNISPTHNEDSADPVHSGESRLEHWWEKVGSKLAVNSVASSVRADRLRGPEVALWFWLSQLHNDAQYPFSGPRYPGDPNAINPADVPADPRRIDPNSERKVFFDFGQQFEREPLEVVEYANIENSSSPDYEKYAIWRIIQVGGDAPLTYFHHSTYLYHVDPTDLTSNQLRTRVDFAMDATNPDTTIENYAEAVMVDLPVDPSPYPPPPALVPLPPTITSKHFYQPDSYQICSAGYDDTYRNINRKSGAVAFRTIEFYECRDNIYSFTDGRADKFFELP